MTELSGTQTEVRRGRWNDDLPVALVAAGAAVLVWAVVTQVAAVDLEVGSGSQPVDTIPVVVTALVAALVGAGLLRVLERRTRRGLTVWTAVAVVVLAVSLVGPLGAVSLTAGLCLALLHLVVGAVVIVGLRVRHSRRVA